MMDLICATQNKHKLREFTELFGESEFRFHPSPLVLEVEETGTTYHENAHIKALAYYQALGKGPVLADDSGLTVEALPDQLGVYSARFGGEGLDDEGRYKLLLTQMKDEKNRKAYFTCVLCVYLSPQEVFFFEGRLPGSIAYEAQGGGGFGYDPIFIPEGVEQPEGKTVTLAMLPEWKKNNSHRAVATSLAKKFFLSRMKGKS